MRKGFTRHPKADAPAPRVKNYITPSGLQRLKDEHRFLLTRERPAVTQVVAWAASNGDRSENADYQYGKRRLRQIDKRIRFLAKRIDAAEVVDPESPRPAKAATRAFFGATVRFANAAGTEREVSIVGTDEVDLHRNHISWVSPLARALMKSGPATAWSFTPQAARRNWKSSRFVTSTSPWIRSANHREPRPLPRRVLPRTAKDIDQA
ncbi:MAG TPA: transcription elongation factor GreB [Vicinamibacterales bacterium]|nr:transcription elongation factor GreB [Vicinamibacterales bacterium]